MACTLSPYRLTRGQLLRDLHQAYLDARRHKRGRSYQQRFERRLEQNLSALCDELWSRTYRPRPSACFIITDPKRREVFAADFRDRIVHHLYYNYVHEMLERTFVHDSYSCIRRRGTHYGIDRLEHHILQESQDYREECYVMKLDVRGYFMHIDRRRLLEICLAQLERMRHHRVAKDSPREWQECVDMDFVGYLTREIVLLNPVENCVRHGSPSDWEGLPASKSLFCSPEGCGLPIGNLTSQLFSNVYLNEFDQYMKRVLHCRHYGRYVDDAFVVSCDREWLKSLVPQVRAYLSERLGLQLHEGKLRIVDVRQGVEFLGAYLRPGRRYVSNTTLRRMKGKLPRLESVAPQRLCASLNSYLGVLSHYASYNLRRDLFLRSPLTAFAHRYGSYAPDLRSFAGEASEGS